MRHAQVSTTMNTSGNAVKGNCQNQSGRDDFAAKGENVHSSVGNLKQKPHATLILQPQIIVHRDDDLLVGANIAFGGLDRGVT
jgi:hypothetical protein